MYLGNKLRIRIGNSLTEEFESELGVRQGDTLSPNLFKIFINDLPRIFDEDCDAVSLGDCNLNCLMYADDVILLSKSEIGLQNCLEKLEAYCKRWCLDTAFSLTFEVTG